MWKFGNVGKIGTILIYNKIIEHKKRKEKKMTKKKDKEKRKEKKGFCISNHVFGVEKIIWGM